MKLRFENGKLVYMEYTTPKELAARRAWIKRARMWIRAGIPLGIVGREEHELVEIIRRSSIDKGEEEIFEGWYFSICDDLTGADLRHAIRKVARHVCPNHWRLRSMLGEMDRG
jgi:hypothetical protein